MEDWKKIKGHEVMVSSDRRLKRLVGKKTPERIWTPKNINTRTTYYRDSMKYRLPPLSILMYLYHGININQDPIEDLVGEEWATIDGYVNYQVSNMGRVKSIGRFILTGHGYYQYSPTIILRPNVIRSGYHQVKLFDGNGNNSSQLVHRLVAVAFIPNPNNKPEVNHKFGIKSDNRSCSLEWTTSTENTTHAEDTGLANHYRTDLSIVRSIRRDISENKHQSNIDRKLAIKYNVSEHVTFAIRTNRTYTGVS